MGVVFCTLIFCIVLFFLFCDGVVSLPKFWARPVGRARLSFLRVFVFFLILIFWFV